jgi:hypothetical protein
MASVFNINTFDKFDNIILSPPQSIQGGSFFTRMTINNKDICIEFPKCKTKQGFINGERKNYTDLLYDNNLNEDVNELFEKIETTCHKLIYNKRDIWFNSELHLNDIESTFTNSLKMYKAGKLFLIRCYINKSPINKQPQCKLYDEDGGVIAFNEFNLENYIIPLIKIEGIKFSSKTFQLELSLSQIMVLKNEDEVNNNICLIKNLPKSNLDIITNTIINDTNTILSYYHEYYY